MYIYINYTYIYPLVSDCGLLLPPENGDIRVPGTSVGITVRYSCFIGYQLDGESTRVCQSDGTWSGDAPFCIGNLMTPCLI